MAQDVQLALGLPTATAVLLVLPAPLMQPSLRATLVDVHLLLRALLVLSIH